MTDRDLLELAAKAAGIELSDWSSSENGFIRYHFVTGHIWNPLTDDGDALRLAVKLGIGVQSYAGAINYSHAGTETLKKSIIIRENHSRNLDPYAATRRAIVKAAAEIGRRTE